MDLNRLRIFHVVAERLNFTRAGEELHLTQPGISKHIGALEEELGTRLFDRLGKRVALTQAGEILHAATAAAFPMLDAARSRIHDLKGLAGGKLQIGAGVTIAAYILPAFLMRFRSQAPAVEITVEPALSRTIVDKVLEGSLELGFVGHYVPDPRLEVRTFQKEPMALVVAPEHRWASRELPVRLAELAEETFLLSKRGSGTWRVLEKLFTASGTSLGKTMELGTTEGVKQGVAAQLGISILPRHVLGAELSGGLLKENPLAEVAPERELYLVSRKDRYLSRAAQAFLDLFVMP